MSRRIYILKSVEGWYTDPNVLATLEYGQLIKKIEELIEEADSFVIEVWEDNKKITEEHFINNTDLDDLICRVKKAFCLT